MKKATGRRVQYLSHQNKMAEAQLGEWSAKLDRQFVTTRSAYELERRQLAQELRDLYRDKKHMSPRSSTPPTSTSQTTARVRKLSVPSRISLATREPDLTGISLEGQTFFRRPRTKSKSLVDLPGELRKIDQANRLDCITSRDLLPNWKHGSVSLINQEKITEKSPRSMHYRRSTSSADSLPPISTSDGMNYFRSFRYTGKRDEHSTVSRNIKRETEINQQPQLRIMTLGDRPGNESKELMRLSETSTNSPLSEQKVSVTSFTHQSSISSEQYGNKGRFSSGVLTGSQSDLKLNAEGIFWSSLYHQGKALNGKSEAESENSENQEMPSGSQSPRIPNPDNTDIRNNRTDSTVKDEPGTNLFTKQTNRKTSASSNTQTSSQGQEELPITYLRQSRNSSQSMRKTSTSSQQGYAILGQAPSQEALQKAARNVSIEGGEPLIDISAAVHGKTRRAGTGLAPYMSNVFLDQAESTGSAMITGGVALDSDLIAVSNFNPSRRPSHGVPTYTAERSRERSSLALRGNRVRQEDPSTAELIRYYQDVPGAAALAGISVEPLDLTELESCRYLRKYVSKSMRDGDHSKEN